MPIRAGTRAPASIGTCPCSLRTKCISPPMAFLSRRQRSTRPPRPFGSKPPSKTPVAKPVRFVGLNRGVVVCEYVLRTAGPASRIELSADPSRLRADGEDICHVEFRITDTQGTRVLGAPNKLTFQIDGPVELLGIDDDTITGPVDYRALEHRAPRGRGLVILRSTVAAGDITMTVRCPGLQPATLVLASR